MMLKKLLQSPINYLLFILVGYSVYDYFEHILRPNSIFEAHPWHWLTFNIAAVGSLVIMVLLIKKGFEVILKTKNLLFEVAAIGIWMVIYILALGPVIDATFWPFSDLSFKFSFGPVIIILGAYFVVRVVINLVMRKGLLYSK
ncbi:hypothetical protein [Gilvibacter sp.]|uniref:hypothetical protein n=1 Tax=Gilvibacter sp. TaxID=2729997 RepID=UPI0025C57434|nr:hypothetical protein [Gilvibacter sp.]NQX78316.1 hypothetical protein [Gilvibacter sp.]